MRVQRLEASGYERGRRGRRPRGVVVHTNAGSFESTVAWFANAESGVSAHYLVGLDGRVAKFVDEGDTARHAGRVEGPTTPLFDGDDPNLYTIGIEFEDGGDPLDVARTEAQYRAGAELLRRIARSWEIPLDRNHVVGHRELLARKDCPGNLDIDRLLELARAGSPRIVCLLPARNAEADLPGFLDSAAAVCDAVVALDDGSTDATRELLAASPLVEVLLENPRRSSYAGWDDAANRARLLEAAGELQPDWIVSLDADERMDPEDAAALREFVATDAIPACAYGLQHFRIWDSQGYDPRYTWVYRLFAWRPGQSFPPQRLHFDPVPTDVPRAAWIRTTLRVRHLGAESEERLEDRLAKYREADPERHWPTDFGRLSARPEGPLPAWTTRPPGQPVLFAGGAGRPGRLVCLLPARNAAGDLPGWFESVRRFADAVVALDDGSTDDTRELLEREPLVQTVLANPRRDSYAGWDDATNRNRLLAAAAELEPDWILSLDADERIDATDAAALRRFVDREALPDAAYGFRVHRLVGDLAHYDRDGLWVYRLFAYAPGQRFPDERLHFVPVPTSIDRRRFVQTTLRIQHLGGMTDDRRRARFDKYVQADPGNLFQRDYSNLLEAATDVRPWEPRRPGLPVVPGEPPLELDGPVLSAIVISRNDEDRIEGVVRAVVEQECPDPFEVIVVVSGTDRTAAVVREQFPQVRLIELGERALPGRARNAGLEVARGEFVSFPGSHVELPQGSLAARIGAHQLGYPMVTGTTLNGTRTRSGWASYFLDHSSVLPSRPSGRLTGPPAHCSYIRDQLVAVGGFPEDMRAGEDTVVNVELTRRGLVAYRASEVTIVHRSRCTNPVRLLGHHFQRGRGLGRILLDEHRGQGGMLARTIGPFGVRYLGRRLGALSANVERWGDDLRPEYRRSRALILGGALAALAGTWFEILRPARGKWRILAGRRRRAAPGLGAGARGTLERFPTAIEVNAYVLPSLVARGGEHAAELEIAADYLTYVSPFAHRALADGSVVSPDDAEVRELGVIGGAEPLLVLANTRQDGAFDTEAATAFLERPEAQERLLDQVDRLCEERGYRGLNLDFERLRPTDAGGYAEFLRRAAERQHAAGRLLSTAIAPKYQSGQGGIWHGAHDYRLHGKVADRVVIMAYEWGRRGAPPGPVAPLDEVREVLRYALDEIPREKLLLGIPLYGYDWALPHTSGGENARSLRLTEALALAHARGAAVEYDTERQSAYFRYRDDDGGEHLVWFEDERSLAAKLDLVRALGLRGVSFWRIPGGGEPPWTLLEQVFAIAKRPGARSLSAA
ncbi:MAG: spore germination protein [Thermoleophilaceae bacterium]|nr:spore germination protein [Thermoleophilaceae bacterium]